MNARVVTWAKTVFLGRRALASTASVPRLIYGFVAPHKRPTSTNCRRKTAGSGDDESCPGSTGRDMSDRNPRPATRRRARYHCTSYRYSRRTVWTRPFSEKKTGRKKTDGKAFLSATAVVEPIPERNAANDNSIPGAAGTADCRHETAASEDGQEQLCPLPAAEAFPSRAARHVVAGASDDRRTHAVQVKLTGTAIVRVGRLPDDAGTNAGTVDAWEQR